MLNYEESIKENLDNPFELERLYRKNKNLFTSGLNNLYQDNPENKTLKVWNARLNFKPDKNLAPIFAKIFSPLVLVTLTIYLIVILAIGKSPFTDRDFLIIFNIMLVGVLAILIFTLTEREDSSAIQFSDYINSGLVFVTLIVNLVALSAIVFRLSSYGLTPNKAATLGANLFIFVHLIIILVQYIRFYLKKGDIVLVRKSITHYIPLYVLWCGIVTFIFPLLFWFK